MSQDKKPNRNRNRNRRNRRPASVEAIANEKAVAEPITKKSIAKIPPPLDDILPPIVPIEQVDAPEVNRVEVIGVRFREGGRMYYFDACGVSYREGDSAIVDTSRGVEYGPVVMGNKFVPERDIVQPLRVAIRPASRADEMQYKKNIAKAGQAFGVAEEKILQHKLDMKLVDVEYTFDGTKLLFYFTSEGRVDFRDLVKELASVFRCRIELRQMGIRDEAKMFGGIGVCGRAYCCNTFMPDFNQVSIRMAKDQGISLNANKISGACGKLMCCLKFEHDTYLEEIALSPKLDSYVTTPEGEGVVTEVRPLVGMVKVRLKKDPDAQPKLFSRDVVRMIPRKPEKTGKLD